MQFVIKRILKQLIFYFYDIFLPLKKNWWGFATWSIYHHTLENPRSIFDYVKNDTNIKKIIFTSHNVSETENIEGKNVEVVKISSLRSLYFYAVIEAMFLGFRISGIGMPKPIRRKRKYFQLWHGIPLKNIGKLLKQEEKLWEKEACYYTAAVCSSKIDKLALSVAFSPLNIGNIWLTGLPRNDFILMPENELPADYIEFLNSLKTILKGKKLILYAPTWRYDSEDTYIISDEEILKMESILLNHNAVFAIRAHYNTQVIQKLKLLKVKKDNFLIDVGNIPEANLILRVTDVLITDYSSIYIDFLLTKRPIIFFAYDFDKYLKQQGFIYDFEFATCGKICFTFNDTLQELDRILSVSFKPNEKYMYVRRLFHTYDDGRNTERFINKAKIYLGTEREDYKR